MLGRACPTWSVPFPVAGHCKHVIPAAVSPPHDRRAHGLPQDLEGLMSGVLTRQPLPEPSLPKPPGKCHEMRTSRRVQAMFCAGSHRAMAQPGDWVYERRRCCLSRWPAKPPLGTCSMTRLRVVNVIAAVLAGVVMPAVVVAGAASAAPSMWERFHFEDAQTHEDTCGVSGLTVDETVVGDGRFRTTTHGPDGLSYYVEFDDITDTFTNVATGETVTVLQSTKFVDHKVTDNGDGTLTVLSEFIGTVVFYQDGQPIARSTGILDRFEFVFDHAGTPTDPSDDVLLEVRQLEGAGRMVDFCATIVQAIG
jgi:hypothetical protein